jgi:hypothetical protein
MFNDHNNLSLNQNLSEKKRVSAMNTNMNITLLKRIMVNKQQSLIDRHKKIVQNGSIINLANSKLEISKRIGDKATSFKHLA